MKNQMVALQNFLIKNKTLLSVLLCLGVYLGVLVIHQAQILSGIFNLSVMILAFWLTSQIYHFKSSAMFCTLLLVYSLNFAIPGIVTMTMSESNALPWVTLTMAFIVYADHKKQDRYLFFAASSLLIGFWFHSLVLFLLPLILLNPLVERRWWPALKLALFMLLLILISGVPDFVNHGHWNTTLISLMNQVFDSGIAQPSQPWYIYFRLILLFFGGPLIFYFHHWLLPEQVRKLSQFWLAFILFLFPHLLFLNKMERFLIPAIGIMTVLLAEAILKNHRRLFKSPVALGIFALNILFWISVSFSTAQKNSNPLFDLQSMMKTSH